MAKRQITKLLVIVSSFLLIFLPMLFFVTGCAPIDATEIVNDIFPNLWVFLAHLFASVVLLIMIIWLVWKPTKDALAKRQAYIQNEIQQAEKARKEAFEKLAQAEKTILEAHTNAKTIVGNATNQAYLTKEKIEGEGKLNAKKIIDDAQLEVVKLEAAVKINNEKEIIDIAFTAAEALIKKNITDEDNKKAVEELIKKMSSKKGQV